jgi:MFS family permease
MTTPPVGTGLRWRGALRHRNFRLFWFGQLISLIGTWMQALAQAWLILTLTHDPFWLGVVAAAQFLPVLILGLFGGVIADVLPKRTTLIGTQVASMLLAFVLAGLTFANVAQVWQILVLSALLGLVNAVDMPTRQAFVVEMVGRGEVTNAVGLNSAMFNAARIVGPAVGGLLIGALGVTACFFLNGLSFVAVIGSLLLIREADLFPTARLARPTSLRGVADDLAEGLHYVRVTPVVLLAVVLVGLVSTFAMNFNVLAPPLAQDILGVGATGLGFLMASMGLGALTAALVVATFRRPRPWIIVLGALGLGALEMILAGVRSYPVALVAMYGAGAASVAMMISANTSIQLAVPDQLRGRVLSVYTTVFAGATPIGAPVIGWLASAFGTEVALAVGGGIAVVAALVAGAWILRGGLPAGQAGRDLIASEPVAAAASPPGSLRR